MPSLRLTQSLLITGLLASVWVLSACETPAIDKPSVAVSASPTTQQSSALPGSNGPSPVSDVAPTASPQPNSAEVLRPGIQIGGDVKIDVRDIQAEQVCIGVGNICEFGPLPSPSNSPVTETSPSPTPSSSSKSSSGGSSGGGVKVQRPSTPTDLMITALSSTGFSLTWSPISGATNYRVYKDSHLVADNLGVNAYSTSDLSPGTAYTIEVSAINSRGESSKASIEVTTNHLPPSAPTGLSASYVSTTSFSLNWNPVAGATSYKIYRNGTLYQSEQTSNSANIIGLNPANTYTMTVVAVNSGGDSAPSEILDVFTEYASGTHVTLAPVDYMHTPRGVSSDEHYVYYLESGNSKNIKRVPVKGGPVEVLASDLSNPNGNCDLTHLVHDESYVYVLDLANINSANGRILKVAKEGGEVTTLVGDATTPRSLEVDGTYVYWSESGACCGANGSIKRVAKTGGTPTTLASNLNQPLEIHLDGETLFFLEAAGSRAIKSVPIDGGDVTTLASDSLSTPSTLTTDDTYVYWGNGEYGPNSGLKRVPKTGGAYTSLLSDLTYGFSRLSQKDGFLFFIASSMDIRSVHTSGGTVLTVRNTPGTFDLFIDNFNLYYSETQGNYRQIARIVR